jgi:outer membrane lipoprotein-sorting protein
MSVFDRRPGLRWAVPAGTAALIVIGAAAAPLAATADSGLPPRSAAELLVALQESTPVPVSGTVVTRADLGLPELPMGMAPDAGPMALASGEGTVRVWSDGPTRQRLALIDEAAETTVVRNGDEVWVWSSAEATATRYVLPETSDRSGGPGALPPGVTVPSTPQDAAEMALAALDPTTEVTTSGLATVAGREAYELVLAPKDPATLVRDVRLFLDARTSTPLRVQVNSTRITDPAFQVGFTSVDFGTPDADLFSFTPPPGATLTEAEVARGHAHEDAARAKGQQPTIVGSGWSTVVVGELPADGLADLAESGSRAQDQWRDDDPAATALALLEALPATSGQWGTGRVLAGTLFSVILTDDGRFAVGAVDPEALGAALADR